MKLQYTGLMPPSKIKNTNDADKWINKTNQHHKLIPLRSLAPQKQRQLWEAIKKTHPKLADLLSGDEFVNELKTQLGGEIVMPENDINEYLG